MPRAEFFAKLGVFARRGFLTPEQCARLQVEMKAASWEPGHVKYDVRVVIDETSRRVKLAAVPEATRATVAAHLQTLWPELERHFNLALSTQESLDFLRYGVGDFFEQHPDNAQKTPSFPYVLARRISVVIFLNDAEAYAGGTLTLYGLLDQPGWKNRGFGVAGEAGLLVAFPASLWHEVTPVTRGERYSIVTWLG
jgi:SM-20-related protein